MGKRIDSLISNTAALIQFNGAGTNYLVHANNGSMYLVYLDDLSDVVFVKSTDGVTWSNPTLIFAGTSTALSIWYDRWSGLSTDYIHCAYTESATDDTLYRTINTGSSDALSTQTVIFAGTSTASGGHLSITRAVGGNVYCKTVIDAGAEGGFYRLPNANVPNGAWDAARTVDEAIATTDMMILAPDFDAADTQDIMAIFWDASANEISRKLYDDSANTWSETSIAASMVEQAASTSFQNFAIAPDIANTQLVLVAWSGVDTLNSDLRCWTVDASTITEVTNVVLNSTDDQGLCSITIDTETGYWYVFYGGKSDGSETYLASINIYYKVSTDGGTTWGSENQLTSTAKDITWLCSCPRTTGILKTLVAYHNDITQTDQIRANVELSIPRTQMLIGL